MAQRVITGTHVLIGFVGFFGVIVGVNGFMAWSAINTFPGLEVQNGYVASQTFNDRKAAQEALGWTVSVDHSGGLLILRITDDTGLPVAVAELDATVGRATNVQNDQTPDFSFDGNAYVAPVALDDGYWNIRMTARAQDGTLFERRIEFHKD